MDENEDVAADEGAAVEEVEPEAESNDDIFPIEDEPEAVQPEADVAEEAEPEGSMPDPTGRYGPVPG